MVGEGVCYTFCCCLEVEWGEVLFTVKYPVDPIPEVAISSLLALLYLTSFMNPMTRRWKDEYRSQIGKSANKYRAGKKKASEETTPPCVQVLYEYWPWPGARKYEPHRRCYVGYYPESQVGGG